ncbi:hypothetical protein N303_01695 [Cuculus canorus]|uniref:Uncharacterized protein n=1 Tax=Cuculus canorus TaxID=55661 RepID=A0A091FFY8_CUCCA|nr:hypothetical protein N303_01695 [Cuculus canorus]
MQMTQEHRGTCEPTPVIQNKRLGLLLLLLLLLVCFFSPWKEPCSPPPCSQPEAS